MSRAKQGAPRRRIGKGRHRLGEKTGYSLSVACMIPPPGEAVPPELVARECVTSWGADERHLADKYLRIFTPKAPTWYQARKLAKRIKNRHPGACNFRALQNWRLMGSGG